MNAPNLTTLTVAELLAAGRRAVASCLTVDRKQLVAALAHRHAANATATTAAHRRPVAA